MIFSTSLKIKSSILNLNANFQRRTCTLKNDRKNSLRLVHSYEDPRPSLDWAEAFKVLRSLTAILRSQIRMKCLSLSLLLKTMKNQLWKRAAIPKFQELASGKCDPITLLILTRSVATVSASLMTKSKFSQIFTKNTKVNLTAKWERRPWRKLALHGSKSTNGSLIDSSKRALLKRPAVPSIQDKSSVWSAKTVARSENPPQSFLSRR